MAEVGIIERNLYSMSKNYHLSSSGTFDPEKGSIYLGQKLPVTVFYKGFLREFPERKQEIGK